MHNISKSFLEEGHNSFHVLILSRVSEWLLFNANSAIFQLYHGDNKLIVNEMMIEVRFVLAHHAELDVYSASPLTQQSPVRRVAPFGHIILIPNQLAFALNP